MPRRAAVWFVFAAVLPGFVACRGSQNARPTLFFDRAWAAAAEEKGAVWFFPAVDETTAWDESQVARVRCPTIVPQYWCAPVEVSSGSLEHPYVYGAGWTGPFGVEITAKRPQQTFDVNVRNQSYAGMGFGADCPAEDMAFPVRPQSFTVVVTDARVYRRDLGGPRYCPATSIVGVVSYAPEREAAQRALTLAAHAGNHASLRIAALEALARSPDNDRCPEVRQLVGRIQGSDRSRRVRDFAKERWPAGRLERVPTSDSACWL